MAQENNYKKGSFLAQLTKGLYDAVVQAQALAENQHIESLKKFFEKDGKPKSMEVKIPDGKGKEHQFIGKRKKAALASMSVNYVPDGTYMTLPNTSMTAYDIGLSFMELEPILEDDYHQETTSVGY